MISVKNLTKIYKLTKRDSSKNVTALNNVSIDFPDKGLVFLLGKSGSGKSTLLNAIGGLDTFDSGEIIIKGKSSKNFKQSDFDSYRNTFIGFIFQEYNILEEFTVGKNLALALELQGKKADKQHVEKLLEQVDLSGYYKRKPNQLSGGQKQRVAIARALIKDPEIIMADEPTGALDSNTGKQVMDTLKKLSKEKLVIIVSHDREFAEIYGDRIVELKDGVIIRDETKTEIEAKKSATGVSYIDDKLIHIKKGQHLDKDDLMNINKMLLHNIKESDTIISFDTKSNEEVKKTAFITDDGNREVFIQTKEEDIKRKNHDPKDFKMIRSKLNFKDSFKMGASSLKHKPIRLVFTILLSVVAFAMFGVVNTLSTFNRTDAVYTTVSEMELKTAPISKSINYRNYTIDDATVEQFKKDNPDYSFYEVKGQRTTFSINTLSNDQTSSSSNEFSIYRNTISGVMAIDNNVQTELNLNMLESGRLPQADDEICISKNIFNTLVKMYTEINSFEDLQNHEFRLDSKSYKVVGVLEDDTNLDKYKDLDGDSSSRYENYMLYSELDTVMNYGLVNMCYVTKNAFENNFDRNHYGNYNNYLLYKADEEYYGGGYIPNFQIVDKIDSYFETYYIKSGVDINNLGKNQAIIGTNLLTQNLEMKYDEIKSKIDEGLTVPFFIDSDGEVSAFELEIVGYFDQSEYVYVSDEFYEEYFGGSDYLITRFKNSTQDKELIKYFDNMESTFEYSIQSPATPALSNFGNMIEGMTEPFLYAGIVLAVFAGLMLMNFISTSIAYKKREIGVLRAIGARSKDVFSIFFSESSIICIINFILSTIACAIICRVINNVIITDLGLSLALLSFGITQILLMFAVSVLVAFISSFFPVYKFARKNPIDSINNR